MAGMRIEPTALRGIYCLNRAGGHRAQATRRLQIGMRGTEVALCDACTAEMLASAPPELLDRAGLQRRVHDVDPAAEQSMLAPVAESPSTADAHPAVCPNCAKPFESSRALRAHRITCDRKADA